MNAKLVSCVIIVATFITIGLVSSQENITDGNESSTIAEDKDVITTETGVTEELSLDGNTTAVPSTTSKGLQAKPPSRFITYKAITVLEKPYLYKLEDEDLTGNGQYAGFIKDLLDALGQSGGFFYEIHVGHDGKYGSKHKLTQDWDGLVGHLHRGGADIAAAALVESGLRESVVDFSVPFQTTGPVVVTWNGDGGGGDQSAYFRLLTSMHVGVWLLILTAYIVVSVILYVILVIDPKETKPVSGSSQQMKPSRSCWFGWSTLMLQGFETTPRSVPGRMLVAFWWIFVLMTVITYGASLVSQFLSPYPHQPDNSGQEIQLVADLLNSDLNYGVVLDSATMAFFKDSKVEVYQNMWKKMKASESKSIISSVDLALRKVRMSKGKFALITESWIAQYKANEPPCDLSVSKILAGEQHLALAVQNMNPLRYKLNEGIIRLKNDGALEELNKKWFQGPCSKKRNAEASNIKVYLPFRPVTVQDFIVPVILLSIGIILTILLLLYQIHTRSKRKPKRNLQGKDNKGLELDETA